LGRSHIVNVFITGYIYWSMKQHCANCYFECDNRHQV